MQPVVQPLQWITGTVDALAITENGRSLIVSTRAEFGMYSAPTAAIASLAGQRLVPCDNGCAWMSFDNRGYGGKGFIGDGYKVYCIPTMLYTLVDHGPTIKCSDERFSVVLPKSVEPKMIALALRQDTAYVIDEVHNDCLARLVRVDLLSGGCKDICFMSSDPVACVAHRSCLYLHTEAYFNETGVERVTLPPEPDLALSARMAAVVLREL